MGNMEAADTLSQAGPASFGVIAERFRRAGQADKAVSLCREGLEKFPNHLSARVTLGWSLLDLGEHQEAFDQLKGVLKRAPDNLAAIRGLAELHERGIGLVFDSYADDDPEMEAAGELDPVVLPASELDPLMPPASDFDPVLAPVMETVPVFEPVVAAPMAAELIQPEPFEDLDPVVEPEVPVFTAPAIEPARFEIEDVIDEIDPDSMFDLSGMFEERAVPQPERPSSMSMAPAPAPSPVPVVVREPISRFGRAPLALRDDADDGRTDELSDWLSRIRDRRSESVSQYMAG